MSQGSAGFTLIELMVTIFVAAILISAAVPAFKHMTATNQLATAANDMVGSLRAARVEAVKRNTKTQFCGDSNNGNDFQADCEDRAGAVYALGNNDPLRARPVISASSLHLKTVNAVQFDGQGLGHKPGEEKPYSDPVAEVCSSAIGSQNCRTVCLVNGAIIKTYKSSGECQ